MTDDVKITDDMLHAFVDGQLSDKEMARVEVYLNDNPQSAAEVADWSAQNEAILELFPVPTKKPTLPSNSLPSVSYGRSWMAAAASIALLCVGMGVGWYGRGAIVNDVELVAVLVDEAIAAHTVYTADPHRPVEVAANEEALLVRWLSKRVGSQLAAPDLRAQGFELVGGRLLSVSEGPAAQFMYEDKDKRRITLFAVKGVTARVASFSYQQNGAIGSFYWADENLRYTIVGDISRSNLNTLAVQVYNQLS